MRIYAANKAEQREVHHHERRSVAHERQRNARNGHKSNIHADILENLEEPHAHNADGDDGAEQIACTAGHMHRGDDKADIEAQKNKGTHKAELFGKNAEHEVGRSLRQEAHGRLGCLHEALAQEATAADGDLRLLKVVAIA